MEPQSRRVKPLILRLDHAFIDLVNASCALFILLPFFFFGEATIAVPSPLPAEGRLLFSLSLSLVWEGEPCLLCLAHINAPGHSLSDVARREML